MVLGEMVREYHLKINVRKYRHRNHNLHGPAGGPNCQSFSLAFFTNLHHLSPMPKDLDCFFITIDLHARYTVSVPAETKEEAMRTAYSRSIPLSGLSDVEKDVVKVLRMIEGHGKAQLTVEKC